MRCRLKSLTVSPFNKKQLLTVELDDNFTNQYLRMNERELEATFKLYHPKRSLNANSYFWEMCGRLASVLNIPMTEIYRGYVKEIGDNFTSLLVKKTAADDFCRLWSKNGLGWLTDRCECNDDNFVIILAYRGSSEYTTAQMSRLIDMVIHDCKEVGIDTLSDEEKTLLLDKWEEKQ